MWYLLLPQINVVTSCSPKSFLSYTGQRMGISCAQGISFLIPLIVFQSIETSGGSVWKVGISSQINTLGFLWIQFKIFRLVWKMYWYIFTKGQIHITKNIFHISCIIWIRLVFWSSSTKHSLWNVIHHINKLKNKNHEIISIDAEKVFDKIQHQLLIKNTPESGHAGNLHQHNKNHVRKTQSKHNSQRWRIENISTKIRERMPTFTIIIQHNFGSPSHSNWKRERNERNPNWKSSKTITVCRWHNLENPKDSTRKLLELINKFGKIAGYKMNTRKSIALYIVTMKD